MSSWSFSPPVYRSITLVSTVLSRNERGEMVHALTVDTTSPVEVVIVYEPI